MYGPMYGLLRSFSECGAGFAHLGANVLVICPALVVSVEGEQISQRAPHPHLALTADREFDAQLLDGRIAQPINAVYYAL